ncbi:glycine zipper 2TM domain-containing protein [Stenotrophomonas sp. SG1]|uniref:glycine zipper 2TM domain-containing protein n=1 Tax=Stenotrophomonas sp. SG1 TaxID=2944932 RepID=UPI001658AC74|nr:glycine zipper 2TM domain-containing protein [Stenotrophomonas sp. SG1]MBC9080824.1 glycine zipper 2TM domain-containing protein [Stenotrophomonas maltophilia]MCW8340542.1 glycine zipper 2TM domain-containing protein [Stenotrophomonas sp. SG1]
MKKITHMVLVASLLATTGVHAQQAAQESEQRTQKAGKIGCAVGGVLGGVLGTKLFKDDKALGGIGGAAAGCGAGNFFGKKWSKAKQLQEFKSAQQEIADAGLRSAVVEQDGVDDKGQATKELGSMVVAYNPTDMTAISDKTASVFDKIAKISSGAKNQLTFTFTGKQACEVPFIELGKRNAFTGKGVQHTVNVRCGSGESQFVISPIAQLD